MPSGRTLVVLRHAKAAWPDDVDDIQRPLAPRGRRDASEAGRWIEANLPYLDAVIRSPAVRVEQTWELACAQLSRQPSTVLVDDRLYAETTAAILDLVHELSDESRTVLLVGHNPDLSVLTNLLTGSQLHLSTASMAVMSWTGGWRELEPGHAKLLHTVTARAA